MDGRTWERASREHEAILYAGLGYNREDGGQWSRSQLRISSVCYEFRQMSEVINLSSMSATVVLSKRGLRNSPLVKVFVIHLRKNGNDCMKKWSLLSGNDFKSTCGKQNNDCRNMYLENDCCVKPLSESTYGCYNGSLSFCKMSRAQGLS